MNQLPLCLATLISSALATAEAAPADAAKNPATVSDRWVVVSLEGKTPREVKSQAVAAAKVQVQPAPASPPLVATVTPDGRVVLHHGDARGNDRVNKAGKPE